MLTRRSVLLLALSSFFVGTLFLVARSFGDVCPDGTYCRFSHGLSHADFNRPHASSPSGGAGPEAPSPSCYGFPNTSSVLAVMKTGASEAYARVPTQLITNLRCLDDFLIFSDMAQELAGYHIHDSLDTVLDEVKAHNSDFELYFSQQQCAVDQENCNKHSDTASAGWTLDKYKNVHIAEKAYKLRPDYDWYIFIDADTYVVWPTLMQWLKYLNPRKRHYLGSVAMLGDLLFGHGGSGYLVSQRAMHDLFAGRSNVANEFDHEATGICCGDALFAQALLKKTGIEVENVWPTVNGEKPFSLEYRTNQWCHPIVTMHHIGSQEVSDVMAFEQQRGFSSPLLIRDIFFQFVEPLLTETRLDWDNGSKDEWYLDTRSETHSQQEVEKAQKGTLTPLEKNAHKSARDCAAACRANEECFQYLYQNNICRMHKSIKHGQPTDAASNDKERYVSGWDVYKIRAWAREHQHCSSVLWPNV